MQRVRGCVLWICHPFKKQLLSFFIADDIGGYEGMYKNIVYFWACFRCFLIGKVKWSSAELKHLQAAEFLVQQQRCLGGGWIYKLRADLGTLLT